MRHEESFTPEEQRGFELFHTEYDPRREHSLVLRLRQPG